MITAAQLASDPFGGPESPDHFGNPNLYLSVEGNRLAHVSVVQFFSYYSHTSLWDFVCYPR